MRGKPRRFCRQNISSGITPADAGKTHRRFWSAYQTWDHPRGCGENFGQLCDPVFKIGSPPRMRGKPFCVNPYITAYRITPADAGKTAPALGSGFQSRDHPRGCGENRSSAPPPEGASGITPADAGKTVMTANLREWRQDHPRGCGENGSGCGF